MITPVRFGSLYRVKTTSEDDLNKLEGAIDDLAKADQSAERPLSITWGSMAIFSGAQGGSFTLTTHPQGVTKRYTATVERGAALTQIACGTVPSLEEESDRAVEQMLKQHGFAFQKQALDTLA